LELLAADPGVDAILIQEDIDIMLVNRPWAEVKELNDFVCALRGQLARPIVMSLPPGDNEDRRLEAAGAFEACGIAAFPSMPRAARALANVRQYYACHPASS